MFQFKNLPISRKLLVIILSITCVGLITVGATITVYQVHSFRQEMVSHLSTLAESVGYNCSAALLFGDSDDAKETLETFRLVRSIVSARIYTSEGKVLAAYVRGDAKKHSSLHELKGDGYYFTKDLLTLRKVITLEGAMLGRISVRSDLKDMYTLLWNNILVIAISILISLFVVFFITIGLQKVISEPIRNLAMLAKSVTRNKDYSVRGVQDGDDEVGLLTGALNEMLVTIETRETALVEARDRAWKAAKKAEDSAYATLEANRDLQQEIALRMSVEEELRKHKEDLEKLVSERTSELEQAVKQLKAEIVERRRAEEDLSESLKEKQVLISEIHHRVRNNLQVIASLLNLTRRRASSQEAAEVLSEAYGRILSMGLIHSQLYESHRFDKVDIGKYIRRLINNSWQIHGKDKNIVTTIRAPELYLTVTQAMPCAIALNEVISNAFRHAFHDGSHRTLDVSVEHYPGDLIKVVVKDNGPGIPDELDVWETQTLGFKLIRNLVEKQLRGTLKIGRQKGTEVSFEFVISSE